MGPTQQPMVNGRCEPMAGKGPIAMETRLKTTKRVITVVRLQETCYCAADPNYWIINLVRGKLSKESNNAH
ncbi:hypothetical protein RIB2604_01005110 [Aspergillus luchuensis]|uniref:Uncharacterized protein n=1 Tax=Aspergillus kawachii TaxID=1069201 RepID=A0A146F652_ASPKA|nr:hypothetical protein RIB2604_01005110 [Aspergillus luchuensis]